MQDATVQSLQTSQVPSTVAPSSYVAALATAPAPAAAPVACEWCELPQAVPPAAPSYQSAPTQSVPQSQPETQTAPGNRRSTKWWVCGQPVQSPFGLYCLGADSVCPGELRTTERPGYATIGSAAGLPARNPRPTLPKPPRVPPWNRWRTWWDEREAVR